ncbi:MAG: HlyD family efflux transporter periplasmic adaptor subunit [Pseudomonadota bacterium]
MKNSSDSAEEPSGGIDPELWARFAEAGGREDYCRCWLAIQCALIANAVQGVVVLAQPGGEGFTPVAKWPETGADPARIAEVTERAIEARCGLLVTLAPEAGAPVTRGAFYAVAFPILIDDTLSGVIAIEVFAVSENQLKRVMEHLQWGASWMALFVRRQAQQKDALIMRRLRSAVDLLAGVVSERTAESAAMAFVTELSTDLECDRVSLAFLHKGRARIAAISHSAQIGERMNLVRAVGLAMDEAIVQRKEIFYPLPGGSDPVIIRDHAQLAGQYGAGSILTVPFYGDGGYLGALTLERPGDKPFTAEDAGFCNSVGALLFPTLEIQRRNDRNLIFKIGDALRAEMEKIVGPRHTGRKLVIAAVMAAAFFFSLKTGEYTVTADALLESAVKRAIVAPFDGFVKAAQVRAGDVIAPDAPMCTLDDRELRIERVNWLSKRNQYQRQYQEASASHDRAKAYIIQAQLDQAEARLELVESRLARTVITAPFTGLVLSGDLSQRLGGAVDKGEILFEVAPLGTYRLILQVDERAIADIQPGQKGWLVLSAVPRERIPFVVKKITPITAAKEGLNFFRVEAHPETASERLRPGMEGVGKISVDRRNLMGIWTRPLREWVRLKIWAFWP